MKPYYRSKTLWGVVIVVVTTIASLVGTDVGEYTQTGLDLATLLGGLLAAVGRGLASDAIQWRS